MSRLESIDSQALDERVSTLEEKGHPAVSTVAGQRQNKVHDNVKPYSGYKDTQRYIDFVRAVKQLCRRRNARMTSIDVIGHLTGYALASVETWEKKEYWLLPQSTLAVPIQKVRSWSQRRS
jgi:uncharacterized protein YbgA (DUF1722 family)